MRGFAGATLSWAGAFPPHRGSDHGQRPEKVEQGNPQAQEGRAAQGERVEPIDQRQARRDDDDQDLVAVGGAAAFIGPRSEEHTSELQSLMRTSYAVFCLKTKKTITEHEHNGGRALEIDTMNISTM